MLQHFVPQCNKTHEFKALRVLGDYCKLHGPLSHLFAFDNKALGGLLRISVFGVATQSTRFDAVH